MSVFSFRSCSRTKSVNVRSRFFTGEGGVSRFKPRELNVRQPNEFVTVDGRDREICGQCVTRSWQVTSYRGTVDLSLDRVAFILFPPRSRLNPLRLNSPMLNNIFE